MRAAVAAVVLSAVAVVVAGCGEEPATRAATELVAASEVTTALADGAVVVDVRSPSEFAAGHLADALNIDLRSDDFEAKVGALDKGRTYVVYCRTGSRAGQAIETMTELGFTDVLNGGAFDDLAAAGLPTG
jgi:rhodanese-related sulfurtransferase